MASGTDIGYYTLPVIVSMEGLEKQVNSKLTKAFGGVSKKTSKILADDTEADLKRATSAYEKMANRSADLLGKVRVEEEKLKKARASGKTDQIAAAEERLSKALRDSRSATRAAKNGFEDVAAAQKRLGDASLKATSGLDGFIAKMRGVGGAAASSGGAAAGGFVEGFGGPIAALGTRAGPIGLALAATAGLGLAAGKVLGDQILAGLDQLQGQADVAAKLGLTPEQIKPIARAAAQAYAANFGESIEGNLDAARAAVQGGLLDPNATQADVEKIVAQLNTVATVTGETIPAAVRTAQQAVRTGLAKDTTEAFDLIVRAQQRGLNVSEDLFDTINEYGTQFRKLGLDGPEAFGLIAQAVEGGARDTDTAADALKEFSIRAIDGSKSTGEAYQALGLSFKGTTEAFAAGGDTAKATFQEVVDRIAAVEDPAKRAQIQVALFGTKAEDLGNAVNAMNLSTAVSELGQVEGAAQEAANTLGSTGAGSIESAKRNIEVAVDNMQQGLAAAFGPALQEVANWVVANQDKIVGFFTTLGHAAISASEFIVNSVGDIMSTIGQIVQPFGDIQGFMLKFQAWQAEIRGDDETAKALREQAEEAFGFGEGLTEAGEAMKNFDASNLHKALDDTAGKAAAAASETDNLTGSLDQLRKQQFFEAFGKPMPGGAAMPGGGGPIVGTGQPYALPAGSNTGGYGGPGQNMFPQWVLDLGAQYGVKPSTYPGHQESGGKNQGIDWVGTVEAMDAFAKALAASKPAGLNQVIWQNPNTGEMTGLTPSGEVVKQGGGYYRNDWAGHQDHVHTAFTQSVAVGGAGVPGAAAAAGAAPPMPIPVVPLSGSSAPSVVMAVPTDIAVPSSMSLDASRLYAGAGLTNAFGPGYEPGIGTPGTNEYGDPGYYRVDERALRDAAQRADDAQYRISEADAAAEAARAARLALDDTPNVDATMIAGADDDVRKAERAAALARREAADAAADAAEVAKGQFTEAKKSPKEKAAKAGSSGLGELGSIASSFLTETFGLPDLTQLMPLQMAGGLLGAFMPMLTGEGADTAGGTSSAPFGIPDIAAPPMPTNGQHGGGGAPPGPMNMISIDQSQNFNNSPVGSDPAAVEKARQSNINRAPRLPIGMGS